MDYGKILVTNFHGIKKGWLEHIILYDYIIILLYNFRGKL